MRDQADLLRAENEYDEGLDDSEAGEDERCWTCGGERFVMVGVDIDSDDAINGPFDGETIRCPNCGGTGAAKSCWYW